MESVWRGIILSRGVADSLANSRDRASGPAHPRDMPGFLVIISNALPDGKELDQVYEKTLFTRRDEQALIRENQLDVAKSSMSFLRPRTST
jgi:hypothetical protein